MVENEVAAAATTNPRVLVMMATYNGEKYVAEQIDSILAQENVDVTLVIRDDGSTDGTAAICEQYAREHSNIDFAVNERNKGCALNFMDMVYAANAEAYDYFAFADQDDYWLPEKLGKAAEQLATCEPQKAGLYYTDVVNVDADLSNPRSQNRAFATVPNPLKTALIFNWAAGCTMVWNIAMMQLVQKEHNDVFPRFQDTWLFLIALTCDATIYADLDHCYLKRRITGMNQTGENYGRFTPKRLLKHAHNLFTPPPHTFSHEAQQLLRVYSQHMNTSARKTVEDFGAAHTSLKKRIAVLFDSEYRLPSAKETLLAKVKTIINRW